MGRCGGQAKLAADVALRVALSHNPLADACALDGGQGILVDGDEATGSVDGGNKITVSASQSKLATD